MLLGPEVDVSAPPVGVCVGELGASASALLRERSASFGVPIAAVLRAAALQVFARWTRSTAATEGSPTFLERTRRLPSEVPDGGLTLELSVDGEESRLVLALDLPRDVPDARLRHGMTAAAGSLALRFEAAPGAFPPRLLEAMLEAEVFLLERLALDGHAWHDPLLQPFPPSAAAARQAANATDGPISEDLLQRGFTDQAAKRPEQIAVIGEITLTYGELRARATVLAGRLRSLGASSERPVAVVMQKGWQQVVAVLGILEAGSFYLPVDANLPIDRAHFLLENSGADLVVTQPGLDALFAWPACIRGRAIVEDVLAPDLAPRAGVTPVSPDALAYVIYTSGSTGVPKGVAISHRSAVNTVLDINRRFGVTASDRVLAVSSLSFDLSVYDIFGTLACGATIVVPDASNDPRRWASLMLEAGVTVWSSAPALMDLLVRDLTVRHQPLAPSLRLVMLSGDWIALGLPAQIRALKETVTIVSLGGATEAGIWSIYYVVEKIDPRWRSIPYGKPLLNQQFHVLDHDMEPCPNGVPGHLYISGVGLAQGYWKDELRTLKAFVRHPRSGVRLYRTGDIGRYLGSNDIEFLGREDTQVKVRGFRVELGEIERVLLQHPSVRDCVTLYQRNQAGGRITAYVVDTASPAEELRAFLRSKLPEYMVPAEFVLLDALPLTKNGKVDRDALSKMKSLATEAAPEGKVFARDAIERCVATIFEQVLGCANIGIRDNFFELGGDSFLVVDLLHRLEKSFERTLPLTVLVWAPTVEQVSEVLRQNADLSASLVTILPKKGERAVFCVHAGDGEVLCYRQLAPRLESVAVYGFETQRLEHGKQPHASIDAMASHYIAEMRAFQPEGPYNLLGHSLGGTIALEMARQLEAGGQKVGLVALLDTNAIVCLPKARLFRHRVQFLGWRARHHLGRALTPRLAFRQLRERFARWMGELLGRHGASKRVATPREVCMRAARDHTPRPYPGRVVAFHAREVRDLPWESEPFMGWADYLPNVEFLEASGGHLSMLTEPHVRTLAGNLNQLLGAPAAGAPAP
jgi:amino acid adenylation domain-containing protein